MEGALIVFIVVALLVLLVIYRTAVVVPQQSAYVVERLGRYENTLEAGFHVIAPFIDAIRHKHSLAEQTLAVPTEGCRTRDDRQVWIAGAVAMKITNARKASYEVADYRAAIQQLARTTVRQRVADVELDRLHADRDALCAAVAADLRPAADAWGIAVLRYDMTDISRHNKESAA
jgi:regulator of protease activity HflC (stomatin/prohibitin superfamily)